MSDEYDLSKSSKKLGKLYPILKDKQGNIIDGFHRENADPEWPTLTVDSVDTPQKLELARLAANFCRRQLPAAEFENRIAFLIKSGMKVSEIAEETGISETTIRKYEPQELKDQVKVEAAKSATHAIQTVKMHDMILCEGCKTSRSGVVVWHGRLHLCPDCLREASVNPEKFEHAAGLKNGRLIEEARQKQRADGRIVDKKKVVGDDQLSNLLCCAGCGRTVGIMNAKNFDGKDLCPNCYDKSVHSKADRQARMHPAVSKFEDEVALGLQARKLPAGQQNEFITLPFLFGDRVWYLPKGVLALRLNGFEAHKKRSDKDEAIVNALETLGVRVVTYCFRSGSDAEKAEVLGLIEDKLKELGWVANG